MVKFVCLVYGPHKNQKLQKDVCNVAGSDYEKEGQPFAELPLRLVNKIMAIKHTLFTRKKYAIENLIEKNL